MACLMHHATKHHCQLHDEQNDYVGDFIEVGLFVNSRRFIKRLFIINMKHPYSKFYATSIRQLRTEQKRHLVNHYHMIHPLSLFKFGFDIFMAALLLGTFIVAPILTPMVDRKVAQKMYALKNFMHLVLIALSFCTGYYDAKNNKVVLRWRLATLKYLRTYFIIDLAGVLPPLIRYLMDAKILHDEGLISRLVAPVLIMIMYGRYFYCMEVFKQVKIATELSTTVYKAIRLILHLMMFLLLTMFLLYFVLNEIPYYKNRSVLETAELTLTMLFMVNHGFATDAYEEELLAPIFIIIFGFVLHLLLLIRAMELWYKFSSTQRQQSKVYDSIGAYMRYKALPIGIRERIWLYLDFKYQGHFYKDSIIKRATSVSLRKEILIKAAMRTTDKVEFLQKLPENVLEKLRANMVSQIYLPDDVIIKAGQAGKCMFFILAGTVRVTTPDNKILCYLRDGAHFGEVALLVNIARVANVVAETPCELFKLSRKCFLEVVEGYPSLMNEMKDMAAVRMTGVVMTTTSDANQYDDGSQNSASNLEVNEQQSDSQVYEN